MGVEAPSVSSLALPLITIVIRSRRAVWVRRHWFRRSRGHTTRA